MKQEIINALVKYVTKISPAVQYRDAWSDETRIEVLENEYNNFIDELKKKIDITKLSIEELNELRFLPWGDDETVDADIEAIQNNPDLTDDEKTNKIKLANNTRNLLLIPLWALPLVPEGTELTCINGHTLIYKKETQIDIDNRFGCIAYGIHPNNDNK